jgi:hypothetical protein
MATVAAVRARRLILADVLSLGRHPGGAARKSLTPPIQGPATPPEPRPREPRPARNATQRSTTQRPASQATRRSTNPCPAQEGGQRPARQASRDSADGRAPI